MTGRRRAVGVVASVTTILVGCVAQTSPAGPSGSASSAIPSPPGIARASPSATPTSQPTLAGFPDLTLVIGTADGDVFRLQASRPAPEVPLSLCPGQNVVALRTIPGAARALALCARSATAKTTLYIVELSPTLTARALPLRPIERNDAISVSPDGRSVAAIVPTGTTGTSMRVISFDLNTWQETVLRPDEALTGNLLWTSLGLTVYRPTSPAKGTLVLRAGVWQQFSDRQLGVADATRALVHLDAASFAGHGGHVVWERRGTTETQLTANETNYEFPLALFGDTDSVVWRDLVRADGRGQAVVYRGAQVLREDEGELCPQVVRSGDWLLCVTTRTQHLVSYSLATAAFTKWSGTLPPSVGSLAIIGP